MMSSLYIGASGLKAHSEGMSVIGHNLANANTVGYKQMAMQYSDMISQFMTSSAGTTTNISQVGAGSRPGANRTLFTVGGFEAGSEATDLAINGIGFFGVTKNGQIHYTRAGNLRFTKTGELLDPSGWNVMGRSIIDGVESSAPSPVQLNLSETGFGYMAPKATATVSVGSRLGGLEDVRVNTDNPFFAMAASYDGSSDTPLGTTGGSSYRESFSFYDSNGERQTAAIYYDKAQATGGMTVIEYVVALPPSSDASALAGTKAAGLLMAGTMTFSSSGELANMTAFTPPGSGDPSDLSAWTPANLAGGLPIMNVHPKDATAQQIGLNFGLTFNEGASASGGLSSAADAAGAPEAIFNLVKPGTLSSNATNTVGETPSSGYTTSDGYAYGHLRNVEVGADGMIRGVYSNNQTQDMYRLSLYRFTSQDGLYHEGNNHYSATRESGEVEEGAPGEENLGTLASCMLEQSNVDYAREFSLMIVTQRGFQMNSKVITTSDTMLQRALELKR